MVQEKGTESYHRECAARARNLVADTAVGVITSYALFPTRALQ